MSYDDNNLLHRKQLNDYLTRPSRHLDKVIYDPKIKSNTDQRIAPLNKNPNTKVQSKNEFDITSNILLNAWKYDNEPGTEKEIRKYLIQKLDSGQQLNSDEVRFMMDTKGPDYPKEATFKQTENLKNNFNKYKETQKPFQQPKKALKSSPVKPVTIVTDQRLKKIDEDLKALNIVQEPEPTVEEIIKERADKRLEREQKEYDQRFGTGGIVKLWRPQ